MKLQSVFYLVVVLIFLSSCSLPKTTQQSPNNPNQLSQSQLKEVTLDDVKIAMGQSIYVPVYSHIYYETQKEAIDLSATLSIRNTDSIHSIIITSVRYYDTQGKLIRQYLDRPAELNPLASTDFVVERKDSSGGSGANFIVEWISEKEVSQPIVEAVMINAISAQGISFISNGRVIESRGKKN